MGMKIPYFIITQKWFHFSEQLIFAKNRNYDIFVYKKNLSAEVLVSENPILCMFFCSSLFFSGNMILYKEPQERNTEGLTGQKHLLKNTFKTFPFTAILKLATRSYARSTLQKRKPP